jgi:peptidyl-prolyl cis-trans isomerase A (cyclophilin A)
VGGLQVTGHSAFAVVAAQVRRACLRGVEAKTDGAAGDVQRPHRGVCQAPGQPLSRSQEGPIPRAHFLPLCGTVYLDFSDCHFRYTFGPNGLKSAAVVRTGCSARIEVMADCDAVTSIQTATAALHTSHGDIKIALFGNHAPKTVANFVGLAQGTKEYSTENASGGTSGPFYDGVVFHRVISGFMIQGGDPTGSGRGGPGYKFADEFHPELRFDKPYLLAMANAGPGTNGSQFFITVGKTPYLDGKHTIFGEVVDAESQGVVDAIAATPTGSNDRPINDVVIESVTIS